MKKPTLRLLVILLVLYVPSQAQQLSLSNDIEDLHLPTREIYRVIQDKRGYFWFATEFGLYRHQQGRTTAIRANDASVHTAILTMCESADGSILFATIHGKIFSVQKDSAAELPFSKKGFLSSPRELIYKMQEIGPGILYILTAFGTYRVPPDRSIAEVIDVADAKALPVIRVEDQLLPINKFFKHHPEHFEGRINPLKMSFPGLSNETVAIKKWPDIIDQFRILTTKWQDLHAVTYGRTLLLISNTGTIRSINLPAHVISLKADANAGLWIGFYKHGYYYFADTASLQKPVEGLKDISVSDVCVDREGRLWITSLERGVFNGPGTSVIQHTYDLHEQAPYKLLFVSEDGIITASHGQPTLLITDKGIERMTSPHRNKETEILIGYIETKNVRYSVNNMNIIRQDRNTSEIKQLFTHNESFTAAFRLSEDGFLVFAANSILLFKNGNVTLLPKAPERIFHSIAMHGGGMLAGGRSNLYFTANSAEPSFKKVPGDNGRVVQLINTSSGNIFALIQNKGLAIFQHDSLRIVLPSSTGQMYYSCIEAAAGKIWIASDKGVWSYDEDDLLNNGGVMPVPVTDHTVYSFAKKNERMYMASSIGIISMPFEQVKANRIEIPVYLEAWSVGDKLLPLPDPASTATFDYHAGALSWNFDINSFHEQPAVLHFALAGPQADSGLINGHQLQLGNLRPGDYQLRVWATRNDGAGSKPITQSFRILPPYWQTAWFNAAVLASTIVVAGGLTWLIIRRIRQRDQQKRKMENDLLSIRLQALQAQMNPHFVFNAINSIQLFILQRQEQEAYHYLTQFSKLIRRVLTQSRSPLISLSDELETLKLYVGLEQLRFPDQFEYTVQNDLSDSSDRFYLPVMLLQPAIENAILHGISGNGSQGKIALHIRHSSDDGIITIAITDNGAGKQIISQKKEMKADHVPFSSIINAERIDTLNKIYQTDKFSLRIQTSSENNSGTTVTISIPDNLNHHA
ncbi:MAG: histidine kinase [Chitinophagaceae bacterium]|nr:histidine kinase [Chitinophagaceae bacterium]